MKFFLGDQTPQDLILEEIENEESPLYFREDDEDER